MEHMKYVVERGQTVTISGHIDDAETGYAGTYSADKIPIKTDFLRFEHTDGLNNLTAELKRFDELFALRHISVNVTEGFGLGALIPKTNTTLLSKPRHDEFHLSGFGVSAVAGLNVTFFKYFFVQSLLKGGYINMPDIRTTHSKNDRASQAFFYSQLNILVGGSFRL